MAQTSERVERRPKGPMKFAVGMVVKLKTRHQWGVVVSWDPEFKKSDEWRVMSNIRNVPRGENQPFYDVYSTIVENLYVAEGNLHRKYFISAIF